MVDVLPGGGAGFGVCGGGFLILFGKTWPPTASGMSGTLHRG